MTRRELLLLAAGAMTVSSGPLCAQQKAIPVIGFLGSGSPVSQAVPVAAFREGLSQTGWVEGQNVMIEYRWAQGHRSPSCFGHRSRRPQGRCDRGDGWHSSGSGGERRNFDDPDHLFGRRSGWVGPGRQSGPARRQPYRGQQPRSDPQAPRDAFRAGSRGQVDCPIGEPGTIRLPGTS